MKASLFALMAAATVFAAPRPIVWPLFSMDVGPSYDFYKASHSTVNGYYHDLEKDVMIHDSDLRCNLISYSGMDLNLGVKVGAIFVRQFAPFVDIELNNAMGKYRLKNYSRDKEETVVDGNGVSYALGVGFQYYPYESSAQFLNGSFIGASFGWLYPMEEIDLEDQYDYDYGSGRIYVKLELGKHWEIQDHLYVGVAVRDAFEFGFTMGSEIGNRIGLYLNVQIH